jgi:DNA helicase HerA-like ATPase
MEKDIHGDEEEDEEENFAPEKEDKKDKRKKKKKSIWFSPFELLGTKQALLRRLRTAAEAMEGIVRSDIQDPKNYQIDTDTKSVTVIDISKLKQIAQKFIVASVLKSIMNQKERMGRMPYKFIVLDELNKYASREVNSPIKDIMLDIAERGRSLGIILIGAQQSASQVEKRIISNSSIKVNGRLDFAEAQSPEYNYLLGSFKIRSGIIKPGTMIVNQPDIPAPVSITFPFPAWATRKEEVGEDEEDLTKKLDDFNSRF